MSLFRLFALEFGDHAFGGFSALTDRRCGNTEVDIITAGPNTLNFGLTPFITVEPSIAEFFGAEGSKIRFLADRSNDGFN